MKKTAVVCLVACISLTTALSAQLRPVRARQYLFVTNASDARATWVNPAGLASVPEASVMAEFAVGRTITNEKLILDQFTLGFNSRGMSVAYLRNRFDGAPSTSIIRVATGIPITGGALGFGVSLYGAPGENARDFDVGFLYGIGRMLTVGGAARHIGRPTVAGIMTPIDVNGGGLISLAGGVLQIAAEVAGVERLGVNASGWDVTYRAGSTIRLPFQRGVDIIGAADLGSNLRIDQLHIGLSVGGRSQVAGIVSGVSRNNSTQIDRISVAGVSSNVLTGR